MNERLALHSPTRTGNLGWHNTTQLPATWPVFLFYHKCYRLHAGSVYHCIAQQRRTRTSGAGGAWHRIGQGAQAQAALHRSGQGRQKGSCHVHETRKGRTLSIVQGTSHVAGSTAAAAAHGLAVGADGTQNRLSGNKEKGGSNIAMGGLASQFCRGDNGHGA